MNELTVPSSFRRIRNVFLATLIALLVVGFAVGGLILPGGTFTVTTTADITTSNPSSGSLRDGINAANSGVCASPCTIQFAVTGAIHLFSPLTISGSATGLTIDGFSAPGAIPNSGTFGAPINAILPVVVTTSAAVTTGFDVQANSVTIQGLVIEGFSSTGVRLVGLGGVVKGSYIGTEATGTSNPFPNGDGIFVIGNTNTIGGTADADRNLISGNTDDGIELQAGAGGNQIAGNYIGTRANPTTALANGNDGIQITTPGSGNVIGAGGVGNVISGNNQHGVRIDAATLPVVITSNRIGTSGDGTQDLGNALNGVFVNNSASNTIGGAGGSGNIISGNNNFGIHVTGTAAIANNIHGNKIGVDITGSVDLGNNFHGVYLNGGAATNNIGQAGAGNLIAGNQLDGIRIEGTTSASNKISNNQIGLSAAPNGQHGVYVRDGGGTGIAPGNDIGFNAQKGVVIDGSRGNTILSNSIHDNGSLGIDLLWTNSGTFFPGTEAGTTTNDPTDSDGVNGQAGDNYQNFLVLSSAFLNGGSLTVTGAVNSSGAPGTGGLRLEIFEADASGTEGQSLLDSRCVAGSTFSGTYTFTAPVTVGDLILATATNYADGGCTTINDGTSEFSPAVAVAATPGIVTNTNDSGPGSLRQAILDANSGACPSPCTITFNIPGPVPPSGVFTIQPTSPLPDITTTGTIVAGATQTAFTGDTNPAGPEIVLSGVLQAGFNGLVINGTILGQGRNIQIRNLNIQGFTGGAGIVILGANAFGNIIAANYIGTDPTGSAAAPNLVGVSVINGAFSNTIGGAPAARNIISGNAGNGIEISLGASNTLVGSNIIGLDRTGTNILSNGGNGIALAGGAINTPIGGIGMGNVISGNAVAGIDIRGTTTTNNTVAGNFIGTDITGTLDRGNIGWSGVHISDSPGNFIGGPDSDARNIISGNGTFGISFEFNGADNNTVLNNYIGLDVTGTNAIGNGSYGIILDGGPSGNTIGGGTSPWKNYIAANANDGIRLRGAGTAANTVSGNLIGLSVSTAPVGNAGSGITIENAAGNTIGGTGGNIIGSNADHGILLFGAGTTGNQIIGNGIGYANAPKPNGDHGIFIDGGAAANAIGGGSGADSNTIIFNTLDGVALGASAGAGNAIRRNAISDNGGLGIDLLDNGVTPNDPNDPDVGPNDLQNFPVITSVTYNSGTFQSTLTGTLNSLPNTTFDIDWFSYTAPDPSGFGEGRFYLGTSTWTTDALGNATVSLVVAGDMRASYVTATATGPGGSTSEFAAAVQADLSITKSGPATVVAGSNFTYTIAVANAGPSGAADVVVTDNLPATFVSATGTGWSCGTAGAVLTCTKPLFAMGESSPITVTLTAPVSAATLNNNATVGSATPDPVAGNNTSNNVITTVTASADLAIAKSVAPATAAAGSNFTFTIAVNNAGPSTASNVTVTDVLPAGTTLVSASASQGGCTGSTTMTCNLGTLTSGGNATVTIVVAGNTPGTISNTATVSATEADPNTANNTSTASFVVTALADVSIAKSVSPATAASGSNFTFTLGVNNAGPSPATNVTVTDVLPAGTTFVSASASQGSCSTGSPVVCNLGTLNPSSGATVTIVVTGTTPGTISNTATVSATEPDPNTANNSSTASFGVNTLAADLSINKTGPATAPVSGTITYTVTVTNNGPNAASNVVVNDPTPPRLTFVSNSGACATPYPCSLGTLNAGQSATITSTYNVQPGSSSITNTANVSSSTADANPANNSASTTASGACPNAPGSFGPADGATNVPLSGAVGWSNSGASLYRVYLGPASSNGCQTFFGATQDNFLAYSNLQPGTLYEWRVETATPGCPARSTPCARFTTATTCTAAPPTLTAPVNGALVPSPITFSWTAVPGATQYEVIANDQTLGTTTGATSLTATLPDGPVTWFVIARGVPGCDALRSANGNFTSCNTPVAPLAFVIAETLPGQTYTVQWDPVPGAARYEVDEATNAAFNNVTTTSTTSTSVQFTKVGNSAQPFFYRVRAFAACNNSAGPYSPTVRIVILPPPAATDRNPNINVPAGSCRTVVQQVFVPGVGTSNATFTATVDKPWLTVSPASGPLPLNGVTLDVTMDPCQLPNGTFTGTVIVVVDDGLPSAMKGRTTTSTPVSISLVTPVAPARPSGTPPETALIIPSVGHLNGINSVWRSDIRVANPSTSTSRVQLTFTPEDPARPAQQTTITVDAGATTALDDIVRNWYGIGSLDEAANGMLEIRPLDGGSNVIAGDQQAPSVSTVVASSRTYNVTSNGTLGQFIPAVPFSSFIQRAAGGAAAQILSLQQISQTAAYRTNFGIVEGSGQPVNAVVSIYNAAGQRLRQVPLQLRAFEQRQLNGFLTQQGITNLEDGRIEVSITSGDGRVTAYASVVDNNTGDPLLVSGVPLGQLRASRWVLPGVANLNTGSANWRTDMRLFNGGTSSQSAQLTFFPEGNVTNPQSTVLTLAAGEVRTLDNVLTSVFSQTGNVGGAVHVLTPSETTLVVTGRTYNQTSNGTFGQFIPAVTPNEAIALGGRSLEILQVEDSVRYRSNIGIAETSGRDAVVELTVNMPDTRVAPKITVPLAANEFKQLPLLRGLNLGNVYNARITVRVVEGQGRVTAYGSVIDQLTQDPTYIPAQQ